MNASTLFTKKRSFTIFVFLLTFSLIGFEQAVAFESQPVALQVSGEERVTLTGTFLMTWGDRKPEDNGTTLQNYYLTTDEPLTVQLILGEKLLKRAGGILTLNGAQVTVKGEWILPPSPDVNLPILEVKKIKVEKEKNTKDNVGNLEADAIQPAAVSGSQPWVSILCQFPDVPTQPNPLSYFKNMYGVAYPFLDHYWREVSYNKINVVGSNAYGWYTLPQPKSYYVYDTNGDGYEDLDHGRAFTDCTSIAEPYVYYPNFIGINLMFNDYLDCCAWGGSWYASLDGVTQAWRTTWEPPWGYQNISVIEHEMGHGFGFPHSSGFYGNVYDNPWDVMSDAWWNCGYNQDPQYGCVGQHAVSFHKGIAGWFTRTQRFSVALNSQTTVTLEQLALPQTTNYRMVTIPIGGSRSHYYTLEARSVTGYDMKLPGKAVIIHEVNGYSVNIIDVDNNGDNSDAGAMWTPGETFYGTNGVEVKVESETATGFVVTVFNNYTPPDLVIESFTASTYNTNIGTPVDFTIRVKNQGTTPTPTGFWVDLYIDHEPSGCEDYESVNFWEVPTLAPGEIQELTYTYIGFSSAGSHNAYAVVDSGCQVAETDEENNVAGPLSLNVTDLDFDYIVESITYSPVNPGIGQPVDIKVRVKNQGLGPSPVNAYLDLYVDHQPLGCGDFQSVFYWTMDSLAAGESRDYTYTHPGFAGGGTYNLWAFADSSCEQDESEEGNNVYGPVPLTITNDIIFYDGFESGNFSKWTSCTTDGGDLAVTSAARLVGNYGMRVLIDDNNAIFCNDQTPNAEKSYRARFYFHHRAIPMVSGNTHIIFQGIKGTSPNVLRVEFRKYSTNYQIRVGLLTDSNTWTSTSWFTISNAVHYIEFYWRAATGAGKNDGGLTLWIDGVQKANLTSVDNDTHWIDQIRFGPLGGIDTGTRGSYYLDEFESRRQTYIGPAASPAVITELPPRETVPASEP